MAIPRLNHNSNLAFPPTQTRQSMPPAPALNQASLPLLRLLLHYLSLNTRSCTTTKPKAAPTTLRTILVHPLTLKTNLTQMDSPPAVSLVQQRGVMLNRQRSILILSLILTLVLVRLRQLPLQSPGQASMASRAQQSQAWVQEVLAQAQCTNRHRGVVCRWGCWRC